jgi:hypothetical protein
LRFGWRIESVLIPVAEGLDADRIRSPQGVKILPSVAPMPLDYRKYITTMAAPDAAAAAEP